MLCNWPATWLLLSATATVVLSPSVLAAPAERHAVVVVEDSGAAPGVYAISGGTFKIAPLPAAQPSGVIVDLPSTAFAAASPATAIAADGALIASYDATSHELTVRTPKSTTVIEQAPIDGADEIAVDGATGTIALVASETGRVATWRSSALAPGRVRT